MIQGLKYSYLKREFEKGYHIHRGTSELLFMQQKQA